MSIYDTNEVPKVHLPDLQRDLDEIFARERAEERRARTRTFLTRLNIRLRWSGGSGRVTRMVDLIFLSFLGFCLAVGAWYGIATYLGWLS